MTPGQFFRASLLLPLVVPFITTPLAFVMPEAVRSSLVPVLLVPMFAIFAGGLPYIVVALVTLHRISGRTVTEQSTELKRLPLFNALVLFLLCTLLNGFFRPADLTHSLLDGARTGLILAGIGAAVGYAYVLIAIALFRVLQARGFIQDADTE